MPHSPQKKHQPERCPYHPDVDENPNDKEISKMPNSSLENIMYIMSLYYL